MWFTIKRVLFNVDMRGFDSRGGPEKGKRGIARERVCVWEGGFGYS